jgi:hypothetical protein
VSFFWFLLFHAYPGENLEGALCATNFAPNKIAFGHAKNRNSPSGARTGFKSNTCIETTREKTLKGPNSPASNALTIGKSPQAGDTGGVECSIEPVIAPLASLQGLGGGRFRHGG